MCILNTLAVVLTVLYAVINEVLLQCFNELVSLRELGKPALRAESSSPNSSYFTVKRAHIKSALTGATSELTNFYRKTNLHKTTILSYTKNLEFSILILFLPLNLQIVNTTLMNNQIQTNAQNAHLLSIKISHHTARHHLHWTLPPRATNCPFSDKKIIV